MPLRYLVAFADCASDLTGRSGDPWGVSPGILWEVPQEYWVGGPLLKAEVYIAVTSACAIWKTGLAFVTSSVHVITGHHF